MPHQCTECGHTFPDGSKEMLSGCPDCGGNKFRFEPAAAAREAGSDAPSDAGAGPTPPSDERAAADRTDPERGRDRGSRDGSEADPTTDSRSEPTAGPDADANADPDADADMSALRRELDDQFESIKILEPGQYELNLMELYNREEYIIALQEDGQYAIEVAETWR